MLLATYRDKNTIISKLIDACETEGWDHVLVDDIDITDYGKKIIIFTKHDIDTLCRKSGELTISLNKKQYISKRTKSMVTIDIYNSSNYKTRSKKSIIDKYSDLCFIKNELAPDKEDDLKRWCKAFLKEEQQLHTSREKTNKAEQLLKNFKSL